VLANEYRICVISSVTHILFYENYCTENLSSIDYAEVMVVWELHCSLIKHGVLVLELSHIYLHIKILLDNVSLYLGQPRALYCIIQKMLGVIPPC
jgi:hypothetical protein